MPPLSHRLFAFSASCIKAEAPLIRRAPIGRIGEGSPASRRFAASLENAGRKRAAVKSGSGARKNNGVSRRIARFQHTWEKFQAAAISPKRSNTTPLVGALFGATALAYLGSVFISHEQEEENPIRSTDGVDIEDEEGRLPSPNTSFYSYHASTAHAILSWYKYANYREDDQKIRLAEVPKHDRNASSQWVIRGSSVYDITDFVDQHPGGEVILRACGGSIDPYWKIFSIHQKQEVYDILAQYHIGEIDERDLDEKGNINWNVLGDDASKFDIDDPFKFDPERDENLIVRTAKPCNAETPGSMLTDFLTPLKLFFVRNHFWVPQDHESPQSITIELSDGEEKTYKLEDLKANFKEHTITVTLQCSGNRRSHMSQAKRGLTAGLQWDVGAIGTANFTGCRLRDVLLDAGYGVEDDCPTPTQCESDDEDKHIHFISPADAYAVSIPLQTAVNPQADVLLAWDMNGEPLNRDHGGPLRAVVPGVTAARSVKWLGRINVSTDESASQWQQRDYKCFSPDLKQKDCRAEDWDEAQAIQETPVQSAITNIIPANGNNKTTVQGFAFSGGGRRIVRVDVSADGGNTWKKAELQNDKAKGSKRWAWTMWKIEWPKDELKAGQDVEFVVKASDDSYNTQPQTFDSTWNFRGLLANAWHSQKRAYAEI